MIVSCQAQSALGVIGIIGLIQVKEKGWGFPRTGRAAPRDLPRGKPEGAALPAQGKPRPSRVFYLDLHSI